MATVFRATVMLVVLIGLPAAWVYYGPLPPAAMGVIQRTIVSAKQSIGWEDSSQGGWSPESTKAAPRFDGALAAGRRKLTQQSANSVTQPTTPVMRDAKFSLASASMPITEPQLPRAEIDQELAQQLEPHLSLLRSLDAADYTLENWGGEGKYYRFRCSVSLGGDDDHTRQFEAIGADALRAVHQVVGEVTAWQNARHVDTTTRLR